MLVGTQATQSSIGLGTYVQSGGSYVPKPMRICVLWGSNGSSSGGGLAIVVVVVVGSSNFSLRRVFLFWWGKGVAVRH